MKNKIFATILVLVSLIGLASCRIKPTPQTGYNIEFRVFEDVTAPEPIENVTKIPDNLPTVTLEGYKFEGWFYDVVLTVPVKIGAEVKKNITLYAKLTKEVVPTPKTYNITFNTFDKVTAPESIENVTKIPNELPTVTVEGYKFEGWFYDAELTKAVNINDEIKENITLYAKLTKEVVPTPEKYNITFNTFDKVTAPEPIENVTKIPDNLPTVTVEGYKFEGWFYDVELTKAVNSNDEIKENITLYAKLTKEEVPAKKYNITFNTFDKATAPESIENVTKIPNELPTVTVEGYKFEGWFYDAELTKAVNSNDEIKENITLYAKLTKEEVPAESSIQKILDEAKNLTDGQTLIGNRTANGIVTKIDEPYNTEYQNISIYISDGVAEILIHRGKGDCVSTLKVGDAVIITGEVKNYKGIIEFVYPQIALDSNSSTPETPSTPTVDALKNVVFKSVEEIYVKGKQYSITATNIPTGITVEYEGNNVSGYGNHLVIANFYDANHNLIGSLYAYINVKYQVEFPEI